MNCLFPNDEYLLAIRSKVDMSTFYERSFTNKLYNCLWLCYV